MNELQIKPQFVIHFLLCVLLSYTLAACTPNNSDTHLTDNKSQRHVATDYERRTFAQNETQKVTLDANREVSHSGVDSNAIQPQDYETSQSPTIHEETIIHDNNKIQSKARTVINKPSKNLIVRNGKRKTSNQKCQGNNKCQNIINVKSRVVYFSGCTADKDFLVYLEEMKKNNITPNSKFLKSLTVKFFDGTNNNMVSIDGAAIMPKNFWEHIFDDRGMRTRWLEALKSKVASNLPNLECQVKKEETSLICCSD